MDWDKYHTLEEINRYMESLAFDFPELVTVFTIGKTVEGRLIQMLRISNGNESNYGVWLDGCMHAREWISTAVVTYLADIIIRKFQVLPNYMNTIDWFILPVANPDGYKFTFEGDRMWRKNRQSYNARVGVDLNRNFSFGWGQMGEEGSSDNPSSLFYRGPRPFSEIESEAIKNAILTCSTKFVAFLSFHCYGEAIIFPWGFTEVPCPDYLELVEAGSHMARGIRDYSGRNYKVGSTKDVMYYASGTSTDWSYGEARIPYSFMVELRDEKYKFKLPASQIIETSTEVLNGLLRFMHFVTWHFKSGCICDTSNPSNDKDPNAATKLINNPCTNRLLG